MVRLATRTVRCSAACLRSHSILILWLAFITMVFWTSYIRYRNDAKYHYIREIAGIGFSISRAMACVVNVSSFMAIIPMCRLITSYIRSIGSKVSANFVTKCIDSSKKFHIICAITIIIAGSLHSVAHIFNVLNFSLHYNDDFNAVNIARFKGQDPLSIILHSGLTGIFMIITLCILSSASMSYVRNASYDLFWFTHHLFLIFLVLLLCHPLSGQLKEQTNLFLHQPGCNMNKNGSNYIYSTSSKVFCTEDPIFASQTSVTWKWILAGLTIYIIDLSFRFYKRKDPVQLLDFQIYKCDMISLSLQKRDFTAKPGQFVYLQCLEISGLEWHPFSISKCPSLEDTSFTLHLRTHGDWADKLRHHLFCVASKITGKKYAFNKIRLKDTDLVSLNCKFFIDGPYSSSFEEVLHYSVSICVAGGIGFTPFASVLSYLRIDVKSLEKTKRLHFFWVCRDLELYKCFSTLLYETFEQVRNSSPDKFEFHLYFTQQGSWDIIKDALGESYPFLKPRIKLGKPCWNFLFEQWAIIYKKADIGLFCCGPENLGKNIQYFSQKWSNKGCHFAFHNETF
ncbi:NADPH oxidase 4 isoform X2 [Parasteatoda tepidariorum]|uniref:NADPH oxidase 4 isoform X2 n=1 Tax=Parasteatoda tepidariorum TaxID=114398 RepID=UPI00077FE4EB|nr:NADPH oxidase 4 isoform X2 [Parasteatoda tepidariorum]